MKGLRCPLCNTPVKIGRQMRAWDTDYGDDVTIAADFPAVVNIFCEVCAKPVYTVFIEGGGIEVPKEVQQTMLRDIKKFEKKKKVH